MKVRTGCISWTYSDWLGSFYPIGTKTSEFLSMYARSFNIVEVDSTFYSLPRISTVEQWREKTPEGFLFSVKLPKKITHVAKLKEISDPLASFEKAIQNLGPKLACVMAQMSPGFKFDSGLERLEEFLGFTNPKIRYAIEFRNSSWIRDETFKLLKSKNACFVWSVGEHVEEIPTEVTTDFLYLRFMGEFNEFTKFDHVQKDRSETLKTWWRKMQEKLPFVENAYVLFSNHFSGYAPQTARQFLEIANLEETS
jgi:uncharacterized protein YecE (DUF72 family)